MDPPPSKKQKVAENTPGRAPAHLASTSNQFKCSYRATGDGELPPYVMSFPQGPPPASILKNDEDGIAFSVFEPQDLAKRRRGVKLVRGKAPGHPVMYEGTSIASSQQADSGSDYWVGVYNTKTKTVQLVPTPALFTMTQSIEGKDSDNQQRKYADLDWVAQRSMLINTFASLKRRRFISTMVANRVNDATSFGVEVIEAPPESALPSSVDLSRPDLPPFNLEATRPEEVYPLTGLAPVDELDFLVSSEAPCVKAIDDESEADSLHTSLPPSLSALLTSVLSSVHSSKIAGNGDTTDQHQKLAALLQYLVYLSVVFVLQESGHHKLVRPTAEKQVPSTILNGILARFASSSPSNKKNFNFSATERAKLLNFICIIAIKLNNWTLAINSLASDLKLAPSELRRHFDMAGCKTSLGSMKAVDSDVSKEPAEVMAKLVTPFVLPSYAKASGKRR